MRVLFGASEGLLAISNMNVVYVFFCDFVAISVKNFNSGC